MAPKPVTLPVRSFGELRPQITPGKPDTLYDASDDLEGAPHHSTSARMSWARLRKRVFDIDIERCLIVVAP